MKKILATTVAAGALAFAGAASAATYVDPWTTSATGGISVVFGNNELGDPGAESIVGETISTQSYDPITGAFEDTFSFFLPDGVVGFTLGSIGFAANSSLNLETLTFNGNAISFTETTNAQGGTTILAASGPFTITAGGAQTLVIGGFGGAEAVYSGTATFERAAGVIPEPGAWALMILGFGGAGAMLRRRREAMSCAAA